MKLSKRSFSVADFKGVTVAVLGFGRSGRYAAAFLKEAGAFVTVYTHSAVPDAKDFPEYGFSVGFPQTFAEAVLVRSPGVRPDIPPIRRALAQGAYLTGEADLFLSLSPATVIGVTGSDGKTTTTALISALLRAAGHRVVTGGNNGLPLLPLLPLLSAGDFAVVELSSFQLMTAPAPDVAVVTNVTPNHLNWHTDFEEYAAAKSRILMGASRLVLNGEDAVTKEMGRRALAPVTWFLVDRAFDHGERAVTAFSDYLECRLTDGTKRMGFFAEGALRFRHNRANLAAAVAATEEWVGEEALLLATKDFSGVPHRLQTVATVDGVTYINSSIDTSPTRTHASLSALADRGVRPIVIAGGRGKGIPLLPMADSLAKYAKAVFLCGETATELETGLGGRVPTCFCGSMRVAFDAAVNMARQGDTVLLSPGATAFDAFRDFEERGDCFSRWVQELAKGVDC